MAKLHKLPGDRYLSHGIDHSTEQKGFSDLFLYSLYLCLAWFASELHPSDSQSLLCTLHLVSHCQGMLCQHVGLSVVYAGLGPQLRLTNLLTKLCIKLSSCQIFQY